MSNQIEFRHLRYFLALSKELHFKKAADKLFISQPGLSRQIKQLEDFIGTPLFERSKKTVSQTAAGEFLEGEAIFMINALENAVAQCREIADGKTGVIKIGFVGSAMQSIIPKIVLDTNKGFPGISFTFEETANLTQVEKLLSGNIDLGFLRMDSLPDDLIIKPIFEDTFSIVLPENHPINEENFESVEQFQNDSFILFQKTYSPAYFAQINSICEDHGFHPKVVHNSVHASTIFRLVENNLGISIIPTSLKHGFDMKIKFIELKNISQKAKLSIAWSKKNRNPALMKVLNLIETC